MREIMLVEIEQIFCNNDPLKDNEENDLILQNLKEKGLQFNEYQSLEKDNGGIKDWLKMLTINLYMHLDNSLLTPKELSRPSRRKNPIIILLKSIRVGTLIISLRFEKLS
jgi:hypothetical protein